MPFYSNFSPQVELCRGTAALGNIVCLHLHGNVS